MERPKPRSERQAEIRDRPGSEETHFLFLAVGIEVQTGVK